VKGYEKVNGFIQSQVTDRLKGILSKMPFMGDTVNSMSSGLFEKATLAIASVPILNKVMKNDKLAKL
jgi:hypothetical protein